MFSCPIMAPSEELEGECDENPIAEQHRLFSVKGRAYYAMMIKGRSVWEQDGVLTIPQRMRLLSGFHDLVQLCNLLEKQGPPEITHNACAWSPSLSEARCRLGWIDMWNAVCKTAECRDLFISLSPGDYIGRLSFIAEVLELFHDEKTAPMDWEMAAGCVKAALAEVNAMSEECIQNLPDMFVDLK
jgi:hypothetical protein